MPTRWSGEEFRKLMKQAGMSPAGFADALLISITTLYKFLGDKHVHENTRRSVEQRATLIKQSGRAAG